MKKLIALFVLLSVGSVTALFFIQEKVPTSSPVSTSDQKPKLISKVPQALDFSGTLVERLPSETLGFAFIDFSKESYQKLSNSVWRMEVIEKFLESFSKMTQSPEMSSALRIIEKLDLKTTKEEYKSSAIYFAASKDQEPSSLPSMINAGLVFEVKTSEYLEKLIDIAKEELQLANIQVEDLELKNNGSGIKIVNPQVDNKGIEAFYFAKNGNFAAVAFTEDALSALLDSDSTRPKILDSERFKGASRDISNEEMISIAYLDLQELVQLGSTSLSTEVAKHGELFDLKNLSSFLISTSFSQTPSYIFRINVENTWGQLLSVLKDSDFSDLYNMVSSDSVMALSIDGSVFKGIQLLLEKTGDLGVAQESVNERLKIFTAIDKVIFTERAAPLGQSILPVPDLFFAIKSKDTKLLFDQTKLAMQQLLNSAGGNSNAEQPWSQKEISGVNVEYLLSPIGIGGFLAVKDDYLFISSNEAQMRDSLNGYINKSKAFSELLKNSVQGQAFIEPNLSSFYLNYPLLYAQLDSLKGLASTFSGGGSSQFMSQKSLDSLKQKGLFISTLKIGEKELSSSAGYKLPG